MEVKIYDSIKKGETCFRHDRYTVVFMFPKKAQKINHARGMYITCCPSNYDNTIFVCEQNIIPFGEYINKGYYCFGKKIDMHTLPKFFQDWINEKKEIAINWNEL